MKSDKEVAERCNHLLYLNRSQRDQRTVIRDLLNGRADATKILIGQDAGDYLPVANWVLSGIDRLAQKTQQPPVTKIDPPRKKDTPSERKRAEIREGAVESYDRWAKLPLLLPQMVRWMAGYGFSSASVVQGTSPDGQVFPQMKLRDSYGAFPAPWGDDQHPQDILYLRRMPEAQLRETYPTLTRKGYSIPYQSGPGGAVILGRDEGGWENQNRNGVLLYEYHDNDGIHMMLAQSENRFDFVPMQGPSFRVAKRFSFDELVGQYDHTIGLMQMVARLNLLAFISTTDSVFAEALALDTPIPTPDGWTTMGEIKAGDLVLGADGLPTEVIAAKDVQVDRDCFLVTFEDGTSVVASDGHLWQSKSINGQREKVRTTRQMFEASNRFRVPSSQPIKLPEADLPIDPYTLGLWLGDGSSGNAIITAAVEDMPHVVERLTGAGYETKPVAVSGDRAPQVYVSTPGSTKGSHGSGLHGELRVGGLMRNKHIPTQYLRSSIDQRLELLRGLMDSDGTVSKSGHCSFSNTNRSIAESVVELLRSLGEVPVLAFREDERCRSGGIFQVTFTARHFNPFHLPRKAELVRFHDRGPDWVTIASIEPVPSVPVRCIAVDNADHLFLAGEGMHVTHNTNIYGDLTSGDYERGRFAVNHFSTGTRVERPTDRNTFQAFNQIDRLEQQLRETANYPVSDDGQAATAWVTGQGQRELGASGDNLVREYQTVIADFLQEVDFMRLKFDEQWWPDEERTSVNGSQWVPSKHINGRYVTRRVYGAMAGLDSSSKTIGLLNLNQAGMLDKVSAMENLDGIDNVQLVLDRQRQDEVRELVKNQLIPAMLQGQPIDERAVRLLVAQLPQGDERKLYEDILFPEETDIAAPPPVEPEMPAALAQPGDDVTTVLARLNGNGSTGSGVQTVFQA